MPCIEDVDEAELELYMLQAYEESLHEDGILAEVVFQHLKRCFKIDE